MNIFVRNVPSHATNKQLETFFQGPLRDCGIDIYHVQKMGNKPLATITVLDAQTGLVFLSRYCARPPGQQSNFRLHGQYLQCAQDRNEPSEFLLRALAAEAARPGAVISAATQQDGVGAEQTTRFAICGLACGVWEYWDNSNESSLKASVEPRLDFVPQFLDSRQGSIMFGRKAVIILLGDLDSDQSRIDIEYHDCLDITLGSHEEPTVTFNLRFPPKLYEVPGPDSYLAALQLLSLGPFATSAPPPKKIRLHAINDAHEDVVGVCFVYRVTVSDHVLLENVHDLLKNAGICPVIPLKTRTRHPQETLAHGFARLTAEITETRRFGRHPFGVIYQVERLARNGRLSPRKVLSLLPKIASIHGEYGLQPTLDALCRFYRHIPPAGPQSPAHDFSTEVLEELLEEFAIHYDSNAPDNPYDIAKRHAHISLVHKVVITPCGTFLTGPEPEPTNRVLRRYDQYPDHFIRVVFVDEDGGAVRYDPRASQERVYHQRFKGVLNNGILVGSRIYSFLGFSHSSLRSQSCWFMAPLLRGARLGFAEHILKELGDFSVIRTPAKCAARIGQNFTDTNATVELSPHEVGELPVVVRNGRDFSDGVGTMSFDLLQSVWRVYGSRRLLKPNVLQIRFQGFKGIVGLDSRLEGKRLMLRSNMKKFETAATWSLEICGANFRPLPMFLNRQLTKIFEDLGIPTEVFMGLQSQALDSLRKLTISSPNTGTFLEQIEGTKATRLPALIRHLGSIGLDYHQDDFLYNIVEMAVISKLREMKYRGRIPVEQGMKLYGIMDETGILQEGEIFVVTERSPDGGRRVLVQDKVVVTRSPALHPGDIQLAKAVDVPDDSPLQLLHNVVVFSQHGTRDLPSQLSGGDLDGDTYDIIYDKRLIPEYTYDAADYPRVSPVELARPVTGRDMSNFFVQFMENDRLGMLSNLHLQLADQKEDGTLDPNCIKLAGMASTAVDFSKTGIAVDMKRLPRHDRCRPDFMSPSPRVFVAEHGYLGLEEEDHTDDDAFEGLDSEQRSYSYYSSDKALGLLFRAIDEYHFLASLQSHHRARRLPEGRSLLQRLLGYVEHYAAQYGVAYAHQRDLANEIRAGYEESLISIIYNFEPSPHMPLTEVEVFAGSILGRQGGTQSKQLKDLSKAMRERFESVVEYAAMRIIKGDQIMHSVEYLDDLYETYDDREIEALPRAIACLEVAVNEPGFMDRKIGELKSFRYVAAAVCLRELERFRITTFGKRGLPTMYE